MIRESGRVPALVAGYAPPIRFEKPLAFLKAFIDDSAAETGDKRLFMAGFINDANSWSLFSEAWDEELEPFRHAAEGAPVRWLHQVG